MAGARVFTMLGELSCNEGYVGTDGNHRIHYAPKLLLVRGMTLLVGSSWLDGSADSRGAPFLVGVEIG